MSTTRSIFCIRDLLTADIALRGVNGREGGSIHKPALTRTSMFGLPIRVVRAGDETQRLEPSISCKDFSASVALSYMCGATPRFSNAPPSFMRKNPLVV